MKIIPSIFLFLTVFFVSCSSDVAQDNNDLITDKVSVFINKFTDPSTSLGIQKTAIDSAIIVAKSIQNDSLLLKSLSYKAAFYLTNYPASSKASIQELRTTALEFNSLKHQAYASSLYGNYFYNQTQYDSAYYYFRNSNLLYFEKPDNLRMSYNLIMMSKTHLFFNDYSTSEELAVEALKLLENSSYTDYIIEAYNILGHLYLQNKNFEEAVNFYEKALDFTDDIKEKIILQNNIAAVYISWQKYDLALQKLTELLQAESINEYKLEKSLILYNIGSVRFKMNNSDGLEQLEESLQIRDSIGHILGKIESHIRLGEFFETKNKVTSQAHLHKALNLARQYHNIDNRLAALKILIRVSDPREVLNYSKDFIRLNDSIMDVRQKAKNQFAKIRFDYSKQQEQNLLLNAKKAEDELLIQKQKNENQLLIFGTLILTGFGITFYYVIKNKHKREKIKEAFATENRIAVRIHDELANDIYNTIAYTENSDLSQEKNKIKLLDNLEDVYHRTRNISKENSTVDTSENYVESLKNMLSEYQNRDLKIIMVGVDSVAWNNMSSHQKTIIYRVLQELMVNMKKHSRASMVMIRFENKKKSIAIGYSDNGVGLSRDKLVLKNGLQNVENRIKTINGTLTFESESVKGLKILVNVPM